MPRTQASPYEGIGFGKAMFHVSGNQCQKRKLGLQGGDLEQECDQQQLFTKALIPKRQCLWSSNERFYSSLPQNSKTSTPQESEILPGCLKTTSSFVTFSSASACSLPLSSFVSAVPHHKNMDVTSDFAADVSVTSAALTSSILTHPTRSLLTSSLILSPAESLVSRALPAPPKLADHFESCLQQRQLEYKDGVGLPPGVHPTGFDKNANSLTQDINMPDVCMSKSCVEEASNNISFGIHQKAIPDSCEDPMNTQMAMDSDYVPDIAQYALVPSTSTPSASSSSLLSEPSSTPPQSISCSDEGRCGFFTCSGLRPSPVTGRLHCLCSASWRGMYGMEAAYMSDYY